MKGPSTDSLLILVAILIPLGAFTLLCVSHPDRYTESPTSTIYANESLSFPDGLKYSFGGVRIGQIVDHEFEITNLSNRTVNVNRVRSSCGCTEAVVKPNMLAPGSSSSLRVTYTGRDVPNVDEMSVYVETDCAHNQVVKFSLSAKPQRFFRRFPETVTVYCKDRDEANGRVSFHAFDHGGITLEVLEPPTYIVPTVSDGPSPFISFHVKRGVLGSTTVDALKVRVSAESITTIVIVPVYVFWE